MYRVIGGVHGQIAAVATFASPVRVLPSSEQQQSNRDKSRTKVSPSTSLDLPGMWVSIRSVCGALTFGRSRAHATGAARPAFFNSLIGRDHKLLIGQRTVISPQSTNHNALLCSVRFRFRFNSPTLILSHVQIRSLRLWDFATSLNVRSSCGTRVCFA